MLIIRLLSRLPFRVLYGIADVLFFVSYRLVRYRRKLVWKNIQNSFPEKPIAELRQIEKDFYRNLCDYAVEMLKLLTITQHELSRRMVFTDTRVAAKYYAQKQPTFALASHNFNWEWLLAGGSYYLDAPLDFVYQPVNNALFDRFCMLCRTRFGSYAIKRDEVARELVKRKDILRCVAIVADQYPGYKKDKRYRLQFLHQDTVFFYGANQLAVMMQYPVIFMHIRKVKRGHYEVVMKEITAPPYPRDSHDVVEHYARAVENLIREDPTNYLWSHNRWKKRHQTTVN